ncbi:c-type cytochrome [Pseudothauera rhizosphaerae]|uniref:C-type cytochrome n=1 Tax=Pseudothauera rhizosphaerae TaxID=2565932 RepID=A0A4S4ALB5_9RHOO|nr:c-type cytochrome [Pseudothauera rhizosphaerae]THF60307.1 c-type cytochrome [Pseudothauera rhizosphaerae]
MKRFLIVALTGAVLSGAALAQQGKAGDYVWNAPDPEKDRALAHKADPVAGKVAYEVCRGCHRADASGRADAIYPQLAGQHTTVLIKQLVDVRAGRRHNPKMEPFVSAEVLSAEDIGNIASYLALLPTPTNNGKGDGSKLALGERLYRENCVRCHGNYGEGSAQAFYPVVASQHYEYLFKELQMIRDGERRNSYPEMVQVIKGYGDDELRALSDYMSRLVLPANR